MLSCILPHFLHHGPRDVARLVPSLCCSCCMQVFCCCCRCCFFALHGLCPFLCVCLSAAHTCCAAIGVGEITQCAGQPRYDNTSSPDPHVNTATASVSLRLVKWNVANCLKAFVIRYHLETVTANCLPYTVSHIYRESEIPKYLLYLYCISVAVWVYQYHTVRSWGRYV